MKNVKYQLKEGAKSFVLAEGTSAAAATEISLGQEILPYDLLALQISATGLNAADGSFSLHHSLDGVNYIPVKSTDGSGVIAEATAPAGNSSLFIFTDRIKARFIKVVYAKGLNTAGTFSIAGVLK